MTAKMISLHQMSIFALHLIFGYCQGIFTTVPAVTTRTQCSMFYFYDYGTEKCEFCSDICNHAEVWKTVSQCEALCPEYSQKLSDETAKQREAQDDTQDIDVSKSEGQGSTKAGVSQATEIIGVVASALLLLLLLGLLINKRKAIVGWFRRREPNANIGGDQVPEAVPLQEPDQNNTSGDPQRGDPTTPDVGETQGDLTSITAVQESGKPFEGNSWHILNRSQSPSIDAGGHGGSREPLKTPMEVSTEGQRGPDQMATSSSSATRVDTIPKTFYFPGMTMSESRL